MLFNSVTFILFLTFVVSIYWFSSTNLKMWLLLIASCVFYGFWRWEYLGVMFISAITDYYTAILIENTPVQDKIKRKRLLAITLIVNLGLLGYFKYLYFFTDNLNSLFSMMGFNMDIPLFKILLPFGISFYTFETISYTLDVYRGHIKAEKNFLHYCLFVTFFPKLVAGPIQRASELLTQLKQRPNFQIGFIGDGLKLILYGLFLKVFLADNLSPFVDEAFSSNPTTLSAIDVWMMAFLFGFQIYFDFSAYSHIALGSAKLMGISIPENFNFPYMATSFRDFWKRWHISLSSWIRDYLYLPLAGIKVTNTTGKGGIGEGLDITNNQGSKTRALFLTWAIMGFWHGANWTFIFWGVYHAIIIFLERKLNFLRLKFRFLGLKFIGWSFTLVLVMLSWIPFRVNSLEDTFTMYSKLFSPHNYTFYTMRENNYLITFIVLIMILLTYLFNNFINPILIKHKELSFIFHTIKYTILIIIVFTFLRPISQFIYFQF